MQNSAVVILGRLQRALSTAPGAITQIRFYAQQSHTHTGKPSSVQEPSYTYLPPGCSLKEPVYISLSDTVHFYDPPPSSTAAAASQQASPKEEESVSKGSKLPIHTISGATKPDNSPHPYKMVDEYSQVTYVTSMNHSMREPKYVSISDPVYSQADKKPAQKK